MARNYRSLWQHLSHPSKESCLYWLSAGTPNPLTAVPAVAKAHPSATSTKVMDTLCKTASWVPATTQLVPVGSGEEGQCYRDSRDQRHLFSQTQFKVDQSHAQRVEQGQTTIREDAGQALKLLKLQNESLPVKVVNRHPIPKLVSILFR